MNAEPSAGVEDAVAIELPPHPYPGLRPFQRNEWPIFFGRERMVDEVVSRLVSEHLVVVHGDSGSGKSSLIRAGVLPRLEHQQARSGSRWRTGTAYPRGGPLENVARAFAQAVGRADDDEFVLSLRRAINLGRDAGPALNELLLQREHDQVCVLIDQFEELFDFDEAHGHSEARLLSELLQGLPAHRGGLYALVTMRSEFLGACARFAGLAEAVNAHQYLLPPMSPGDLVRAVREPAELYGGSVEPALAERLASDAQAVDGLPLVQHALMLLYQPHAGHEGWKLTLEELNGLGGVELMLSAHADRVLTQVEGVPPEQSVVVRDVFSALTQVNAKNMPLRRPQRLAALQQVTGAEPAWLGRVIDRLAADGVSFLVRRVDPQGDWIDIGHEALIRCWRTLCDPQKGWLQAEFRNGLIWRALLVQADSFESNPGSVLSAAATDIRAEWLKDRREAWAERYGGGWSRVQKLIEASKVARDKAVHQRERDQLFWSLLRLGLVALAAALGFGHYAKTKNDQLVERNRELVAERDHNKALLTQVEEERDRNRALATQVSAERDREREVNADLKVIQVLLAGAKDKSAVDLRSVVKDAAAQISVVTKDVPATAPRVYLHIGEESQRAAADNLRGRIARVRIGSGKDALQVTAQPVQLVLDARVQTGFRCFRQTECTDTAPELLKQINALLQEPKLRLLNLSARYENDADLRPHHYEVWFGPGDVTLAPQPPTLPPPPKPPPAPEITAFDRARLLAFRLAEGRPAASLAEAHNFRQSEWEWATRDAQTKGVTSALGMALIFDTAVAHSTFQAGFVTVKLGAAGQRAWADAYLRKRDSLRYAAPPDEEHRVRQIKDLVYAGGWELNGESIPSR